MNLRIAHVSATFPPYHGGTGNVCLHNTRALAQRGHDVHVFTPRASATPSYEIRDGVTIHRLRPTLRFGNAALLPGLFQALYGFDIVHLHYPFFGGEITTAAALSNRIPLFVTYHQDVHLKGILQLIASGLRSTLGRWTLRSATRLLFTSLDYSQSSHVKPMLCGRLDRVDELPNGVDIAVFSPAPPSPNLKAMYNIRPTDQVVLIVAGLDQAHHFKGVPIFLQALAQLPSSVKGIIVGDGDMRSYYVQQATALGIASRIFFTGRVADAALPHYYQLADLTVLPSTTMGEAFGLVLLESLACATPVIASNLPGVRTVVDHGRDGLLVPAGNAAALARAIRVLLDTERARETMGLRGRLKVEKSYNWAQIGALLEGFYWQALNDRGAQVTLQH